MCSKSIDRRRRPEVLGLTQPWRMLAKWLAGTLALLVCVALPTWLFDADLLPDPVAVLIRAAAMMLKSPMEGGYPVPQLGGDYPVTGIIVLGGHSSRFLAAAGIAKNEP